MLCKFEMYKQWLALFMQLSPIWCKEIIEMHRCVAFLQPVTMATL